MSETNSTTLRTRIVHKHDLESNWLKATNFIPLKGELIIYDTEVDKDGNILQAAYSTINPDGTEVLPNGRQAPITYERQKIGDGIHTVSDLPFSLPEIHNDEALLSLKSGCNSRAGSKAFTITGINKQLSGYTLDSTEGLEVGDTYSIHLAHTKADGTTGSAQSDLAGKITQIGSDYNNVKFVTPMWPDWMAGHTTYGNISVEYGSSTVNIGNFAEYSGSGTAEIVSGDPLKGEELVIKITGTYTDLTYEDPTYEHPYEEQFTLTYFGSDPSDSRLEVNAFYWEEDRVAGYVCYLDTDPMVVLVDTFFDVPAEATFRTPDSYLDENGIDSEVNTFRIPAKPDVGTRQIGALTFAAGYESQALSKGAQAEGAATIAHGSWSHTEGYGTKAAYSAHAEGKGNSADGMQSHAEGFYTLASGDQAHSEGHRTEASGEASHAEGSSTKSIGKYSHTEGLKTTVEAESAGGGHAEGSETVVKGYAAHAEGNKAKAIGSQSHAEGYNTQSEGSASHTEGVNTSTGATAQGAHAEGNKSKAINVATHAEGTNTTASGDSSHSEGTNTNAVGKSAHAEGYSDTSSTSSFDSTATLINTWTASPTFTRAQGQGSHAEGNNTLAVGNYSHTEGCKTSALGDQSHAEGWKSSATAGAAHAEGVMTKAAYEAAHAEGNSTIASGSGSHAEGKKGVASGEGAHVEGLSSNVNNQTYSNETALVEAWETGGKIFTRAYGLGAHAEGNNTLATGDYSHAEGCKTLASGPQAHAEGWGSKATATASHAEGNSTEATASYAHAEGYCTIAGAKAFTILGIDAATNTYTLDSTAGLAVGDEYSSHIQYKNSSAKIESLQGELCGKITSITDEDTFAIKINHLEGTPMLPSGVIAWHDSGTYSITRISHTTCSVLYTSASASSSNIGPVEVNYSSEKASNGNLVVTIPLTASIWSRFTVSRDDNLVLEVPAASDYTAISEFKINNNFKNTNEGYYVAGTQAVTVDTFFDVPSGTTFTTSESYIDENGFDSERNTFRIIAKPNIGTRSIGQLTRASGYNTKALSKGANASGSETTAYGSWSYTEGRETMAGYLAHAEGNGTKAVGQNSHSEGNSTVAKGVQSHTEGEKTVALGRNAHAEGLSNNLNTTKFDNILGFRFAWTGNPFSSAQGDGSHIEGNNTVALANYAHAEGCRAVAFGNQSHAEGYCTEAEGSAAHAEGLSNKAVGDGSHAEGESTQALLKAAHSEGYQTKAAANYSHSEGQQTVAKGDASHTEGRLTATYGQYAHAEGHSAKTALDPAQYDSMDKVIELWYSSPFTLAYGKGSHAEGYSTVTVGEYSHAEGNTTLARGKASHTEGTKVVAFKEGAHAEGYSDRCYQYAVTDPTTLINTWSNNRTFTAAYGKGSHAEGNNTLAIGNYSHTEGCKTLAVGDQSHAEGSETEVHGYAGHAEGNKSKAIGNQSHAEGYNTQSKGSASHTEGVNTIVESTAQGAHAEGEGVIAVGVASHAEGYKTTADGAYSHAEGYSDTSNSNSYINSELINAWKTNYNFTRARGKGSHVEGNNTLATGDYSHAQGCKTLSSGSQSHAEGWKTEATGSSAHAEGASTIASNTSAHAEGNGTNASGPYSHAEGNSCQATGESSHAQGEGTYAKGKASFASGVSSTANAPSSTALGWNVEVSTSNALGIGQFNSDDTNALFMVGNGYKDSNGTPIRRNAFKVTNIGEVYATGDVYTSGAFYVGSGDDKQQLATQAWVESKLNELATLINAINNGGIN